MTQTLKFLTAQLEDRCNWTTSLKPPTSVSFFCPNITRIFTDFSHQLKVTGSPRWRERRCQDQLNHKPRSRSRHLGDSRCTRALEFSEFDLTGLPYWGSSRKRSHNFPADFPQTRAKGLDVPFYLLGGLVHCSLHGILVGGWGGWGGCKNDISTALRLCALNKKNYKWGVWVPTTVKHMILSYRQLSEQWTRYWNYVTTCPLIQIILQRKQKNNRLSNTVFFSYNYNDMKHACLKLPPLTKKHIALAEFLCSYLPCKHEWFSALIGRSCWKNLRVKLCTLRKLWNKYHPLKTHAAAETWHFQQEMVVVVSQVPCFRGSFSWVLDPGEQKPLTWGRELQ